MAERVDATVEGRRPLWMAGLVLLAGLLATGWLYGVLRASEDFAARSRFDGLVERATTRVRERLAVYPYGLRGTRALWLRDGTVTEETFRRYIDSRDVMGEFRGALGLGFITRVPRAQLGEFVSGVQAQARPGFSVRTSGAAEDLLVITYIEPLARNAAARGFDIGSEPRRREAAEQAMLTGLPSVTRRIELVQDERQRPGLLYLLPVYRPGDPIGTEEERARACLGWVYFPLLLDEVMAGVLEEADGMLDVEIFDQEETKPAMRLYDADEHLLRGNGDRSSLYQRQMQLAVGGRTWRLDFSSTPKFEATVERSGAAWALSSGLLLSLMGSTLVWSLGSGQARARREAVRLTLDNLQAREKAEQALREVEWLRQALDQHALVAVTDPDGVITAVNDTFCRLSGYSSEELIGRTHRLLESGRHPASRWQDLRETLARGQTWRGVICNRAKDGHLYWVDTAILPCGDSSGRIDRHLSIGTDVTARQQAEEQILASRKLLADVLSAASEVSIVATDPAGLITLFNRGAERLTGWTAEELVGRATPERLHVAEEVEARAEEILAATGRKVEGIRVFTAEAELQGAERRDWTYVRRDGTRFPVSLVVTAMRDGEGRITGYLGIAQDVTQLRQATAELAAARDQALEASRLKSEFLATMSHEIRTPMNGMFGMIEHLAGTGLDETQRQALEVLQRSAESLRALLDDILDLSKIEAGRLALESAPFEPAALAAEAAAALEPVARSKGLRLDLDTAGVVGSWRRGDAVRLRQILLNLLSNAVKFTAAGSVSLRVFPGEGAVVLFTVTDTGIGIAADDLPRLFQNFVQVDASTARKFGGSGLGLAICRRLAALMGGELAVTSEPGHGSTFTLAVPLAPAAPRASTSAAPAAGKADWHGRGLRVLVVDDNETNQLVAVVRLQKLGLEVKTASGGTEALRLLADERFDLVMMDVQMPGLDGYETTRRIRAGHGGVLRPEVPVVAMTANAMQGDAELCLEAGMNDYLAKPIHGPTLEAVLRRWLPPAG